MNEKIQGSLKSGFEIYLIACTCHFLAKIWSLVSELWWNSTWDLWKRFSSVAWLSKIQCLKALFSEFWLWKFWCMYSLFPLCRHEPSKSTATAYSQNADRDLRRKPLLKNICSHTILLWNRWEVNTLKIVMESFHITLITKIRKILVIWPQNNTRYCKE